MANSRVHGAFGLLKNSIGSLVYSRGKDGAGKTIQIVRQKPTEVYNPRTVGQILQRAKIKPAQRFYNALVEILDHSWQGVTYGTPSRNYFLSKALALTGPYIPKSVTQMIPAKYPVSEGSIASILVDPTAAEAAATNVALQALTLDAAAVQKLVAAGVAEGAQLTVIAFYKRQSGEYAYAYGRLINSVGSLFDWQGSTAANMTVTLVPATSKFHISAANGQATVAVAAIVSKLNGSTWERSTQEMVLTETMEEGLYNESAKELTIESYGDVVDVNRLNSAWYLNLANGQAWPGQIMYRNMSVDANATKEVVVYGQIVQPSGTIKQYVFTDNGAANGHLINLVNGQCVVSENTAEFLISADGYLYMAAPELWLNVYATQLGF